MSAPVNFYCSSATACSRPAMSTTLSPSTSSYLNSYQKALCGHYSSLGRCHFTPWNGLRQLGITISPKPSKLGRDGSSKRMIVRASLFGVGAPEALVIGVVALLVFGPKGLAEVARNLGKTLRAFQPTIRELQDVSREFKSTLEKEIGLDDTPSSSPNTYNPRKANSVSDSSTSGNEDSSIATDPNGAPPNRAYSTEDFLRITEEQLKASTAQQQEVASPPEASQTEPPIQSQPPAAVHDTASAAPPTQKPENKS